MNPNTNRFRFEGQEAAGKSLWGEVKHYLPLESMPVPGQFIGLGDSVIGDQRYGHSRRLRDMSPRIREFGLQFGIVRGLVRFSGEDLLITEMTDPTTARNASDQVHVIDMAYDYNNSYELLATLSPGESFSVGRSFQTTPRARVERTAVPIGRYGRNVSRHQLDVVYHNEHGPMVVNYSEKNPTEVLYATGYETAPEPETTVIPASEAPTQAVPRAPLHQTQALDLTALQQQYR